MTEQGDDVKCVASIHEVRAAATQVLREFGENYRYTVAPSESCRYVEYDADNEPHPSCLVAQIAVRLGNSLTDLLSAEGQSAVVLEDMFDKRARAWLETAQTAQDDGHTWGDAVARADRLDLCVTSQALDGRV